ncbi:MAG TPA: hypothetical protein DEH78_05855, partial [Solibacterales bacterium]|nr:hypothetical protein [Bryobacterales bacterium]
MRMKLMIALACAAGIAAAQDKQEKERWDIRVPSPEAAGARVGIFAGAGGSVDVLQFVGAGQHFEFGTVKGAPYSGEAVSETSQRLADGNRISRKDVSKVWRDGEGRSRRETLLSGVGPWASAEAPREIVWINDPVARTMVHLNPATKVARKIAWGPSDASITFSRSSFFGALSRRTCVAVVVTCMAAVCAGENVIEAS